MDSVAGAGPRQRGRHHGAVARSSACADVRLPGLLPRAADPSEEEGVPDQRRDAALVAVAPLLQPDTIQLHGGLLEGRTAELQR